MLVLAVLVLVQKVLVPLTFWTEKIQVLLADPPLPQAWCPNLPHRLLRPTAVLVLDGHAMTMTSSCKFWKKMKSEFVERRNDGTNVMRRLFLERAAIK